MKAIYAVAAVSVLGLGVAGWAALARGQTGGSSPPATDNSLLPVKHSLTLPDTLPPATIPPPSPRLENVVSPTSHAPAPPPSPAAPPALPPLTITTPKAEPKGPQKPILDERGGPALNVQSEATNHHTEQAVTLEWLGPPVLKLQQPAAFSLVVRNVLGAPVQQVQARVRVPSGLVVVAAEPKATSENGLLVWELGTLAAHQEKTLHVQLKPEARGEVTPQAWVTFTCSSVLHVKVHEPRLALKAQAPQKVLLGDTATIAFTLTNTGDGPAEHVKIQADLSDGLEHASGKHLEFNIGTLAPGESRGTTLACSPKRGGTHSCEARATADSGLLARDRATLSAVSPLLEAHISGPSLRYVDRKALYTLRVKNAGDVAATNVMLVDTVPEGFKFLGASDEGQNDPVSRQVAWFLNEIGPGQAKEVHLELLPITLGEHSQKVVVQAAHGLKAATENKTKVEGLAAILTEVVDTDDPIEVGAETTFEVRIINSGSKADTDLKLVCTLPDKMEFKTAKGPSRFKVEGKNVVFEPLACLAPRGDALYRITVKGVAPGDVRFKVQVTSANLSEPILRTESTRIYADGK